MLAEAFLQADANSISSEQITYCNENSSICCLSTSENQGKAGVSQLVAIKKQSMILYFGLFWHCHRHESWRIAHIDLFLIVWALATSEIGISGTAHLSSYGSWSTGKTCPWGPSSFEEIGEIFLPWQAISKPCIKTKPHMECPRGQQSEFSKTTPEFCRHTGNLLLRGGSALSDMETKGSYLEFGDGGALAALGGRARHSMCKHHCHIS